MSAASPVVVLEFNELCPSLLDRFMQQGDLPGFKRLYDQSHVFTTIADEREGNLDPWIQWITVHSGVNQSEHGIALLGDGHLFEKPRVWDLLSDAGFKVWVCGSMNVRYDEPINGYVLPDPWSVKPPPFPPDYFNAFFKFVRNHVLEHTNGRVALTKGDLARFLGFMVAHGLSFKTVKAIIKQLASERGGRNRWKRAAILDKLQFDLFCNLYRKARPDFSTFFLNSTAHMQHCYWRNMQPELFDVKPTENEQSEYDTAVLFGYREMDRLVTRLLPTLGDDATILLCTALSQQPCLAYEKTGGKMNYRPSDFKQLLKFAGIEAKCQVVPVMSEQFNLVFADESEARQASQLLTRLHLDGMQVLNAKVEEKRVLSGCRIFRGLPEDAQVRIDGTATTIPFSNLFCRVALKSGMHHPSGALWIRTPAKTHAIHQNEVALDSVAPTLLSFFDLPKPAFMSGNALELAPQKRQLAAVS